MAMKHSRFDIEALRAKLVQQREDLNKIEQTGDEAAATVELDQSRVGRLSRMDAMQAQAMSVESRSRRQLKLRQIEAALQRMAGEDYGECLSCGEEIASARIEYDPAVTLCIECASKSEN
ncbi:MAG: TraR/DksA family transcriptional regulator [Gammaproteobacteria bacterium]|nr:TraR/DksA family transcriptional regulator [Gammaproteobacteria bacterium]